MQGVISVLSIGVMKTTGWEYYACEVTDGLEDYYAGRGGSAGYIRPVPAQPRPVFPAR